MHVRDLLASRRMQDGIEAKITILVALVTKAENVHFKFEFFRNVLVVDLTPCDGSISRMRLNRVKGLIYTHQRTINRWNKLQSWLYASLY